MSSIETDYLVVGAGASGMAFVDSLLEHSDADVIMVDRRHSPGGHWHNAYPFVRLHQAAACYGVSSTELGKDRIDESGHNAGMYELSSAAEICHYFSEVLNRVLLPTGRVRFLGMTEFYEDRPGEYRLVSLLTGAETTVHVRRRLIDATYMEPDIPSLRKPAFEVDPTVTFVPPNDLVNLGDAPAGFTVIGAGKTGMDVCTWLLDNGVDPDSISWIRPRDGWYIDRSLTQPLDLVHTRVRYQSLWAQAAAEASSGRELASLLEEAGLFCRLDQSTEPTQFRGATISRSELQGLATIGRVSRTGRVQRIDGSGIDFDNGRETRPRGEVYVDCTATGLRTIKPRPVFEPGRLTLQYVTPGYACWSAATLAVVEATRDDDDEKNYLSLPVVYTGHVDDLLSFTSAFLHSAARRQAQPDIAAWSSATRLNPARGLDERKHQPAVSANLADLDRWREPAMTNLKNYVDSL
ncbi:NAD(P)-binding protein [Mycolicibacterium goodii]|uniref:NAD(P)-binding protein n=1 Tax=Mycolicibacterium goodii TaxID=134601 RepID=UPI001BDD664A|nr:NAD(P)-binding protein [Mycolicibacterium goodii]MBU8834500.1 NAD(P)-binding protein [Mycolicibacterium goodii]